MELWQRAAQEAAEQGPDWLRLFSAIGGGAGILTAVGTLVKALMDSRNAAIVTDGQADLTDAQVDGERQKLWKDALVEMREEMARTYVTQEELRRTNREQKATIQELQEQIADLEQQLRERDRRIAELERRVDTLRQSETESDVRIRELEQLVERLQKRIESLELERDAIAEERDTLRERLASYEETVDELANEASEETPGPAAE